MKTKKPHILMITESNFPADIRVRNEAFHLREKFDISVIGIKNQSEKYYEKDGNITIYRVPELPDMNFGRMRYVIQYIYFTFVALCIFICTAPLKRYKVIHVHNPPDTLFVVGLVGKLFGIKFIFDHHDLSPNLYLTRFPGHNDLLYKILIACERWSCRLADAVIATNETYKEIEQQRHKVDPEKISVVRNNPKLEDCVLVEESSSTSEPAGKGKKLKTLLFIGAINPQDGLPELLQVLHHLVYELEETGFVCNIVGDGDSLESVKHAAGEMRLGDYVNFTGSIDDREKVKRYLASADIGVEPAPKNELNNHSTFIKIMEYMAVGKPIVAFDLKETRYSTNGAALLVPPGDIECFSRKIKELIADEKLCKSLGELGEKRIRKELNWNNAAKVLEGVYFNLLSGTLKN